MKEEKRKEEREGRKAKERESWDHNTVVERLLGIHEVLKLILCPTPSVTPLAPLKQTKLTVW